MLCIYNNMKTKYRFVSILIPELMCTKRNISKNKIFCLHENKNRPSTIYRMRARCAFSSHIGKLHRKMLGFSL